MRGTVTSPSFGQRNQSNGMIVCLVCRHVEGFEDNFPNPANQE